MADERKEGILDKAKGRVKEAAGSLAGDEKLKQEGQEDQKRGAARDELEDAKEKVERKTKQVHRRES